MTDIRTCATCINRQPWPMDNTGRVIHFCEKKPDETQVSGLKKITVYDHACKKYISEVEF